MKPGLKYLRNYVKFTYVKTSIRSSSLASQLQHLIWPTFL